jgi:D-alanyl-D-alanine carboxypeptidase
MYVRNRPFGLFAAAVVATVLSLGMTAVSAAAVPRPPGRTGAAGASAAPPGPDRLADQIVRAGAPGALLAVRTLAGTAAAGSGLADLRTRRAARPGDRYRIGSGTKTMVATVVLQLVAEGRLGLDDEVTRWLRVPGLDGRITVRHLLQHTSGLHRDQMLWRAPTSFLDNRFRRFAPAEIVRIALTNPQPRPAPGSTFEYSNTNYVLAGMLVERVTRRSVEGEITRRVIRPLGMRDTVFPYDTTHVRGRHLSGYVPRGLVDGSPDQAPYDATVYNMSWAWTAGAVVSTAGDQATFLHGLLSGRLLPGRQLAQMLTTGRFGYGLGIFPVRIPCAPGVVWGHDGVIFGYSTVALGARDGGRQAVAVANLSFDADNKIYAAVGDAAVAAFCP